MAEEIVTRIVPVVTTWWGGEPVKCKLIIKIDRARCLLELVDYTVYGWGYDLAATAWDIDVGIYFRVKVTPTNATPEPCEDQAGKCKKVLNIKITVEEHAKILDLGPEWSRSDVDVTLTTTCRKECCPPREAGDHG